LGRKRLRAIPVVFRPIPPAFFEIPLERNKIF
jgi:hypothetical protein